MDGTLEKPDLIRGPKGQSAKRKSLRQKDKVKLTLLYVFYQGYFICLLVGLCFSVVRFFICNFFKGVVKIENS